MRKYTVLADIKHGLQLFVRISNLDLIKVFDPTGRTVQAACERSDSADLHVNDLTVASATWSRNYCVFLEALLQLGYHKADERGHFVTTLDGSQWVARLSPRFVSNDFTWMRSVGIRQVFATSAVSRQARLTHLAFWFISNWGSVSKYHVFRSNGDMSVKSSDGKQERRMEQNVFFIYVLLKK